MRDALADFKLMTAAAAEESAEEDMMTVTAAEFHANFGKYLDMLSGGDIYITQNGRTVAKLVKPAESAVDSLSGLLAGTLPADFDAKALREERLKRYEIDG